MSLREAVLEIAQQMATDVEDRDDLPDVMIIGYIRQLRSVCKAAGAEERAGQPAYSPLLSPETQHRNMIENAKKEFRGKKDVVLSEEAEPRMVELIGEKGDPGVLVPVFGDMPMGAKMFFGGDVYVLGQDGKLRMEKV